MDWTGYSMSNAGQEANQEQIGPRPRGVARLWTSWEVRGWLLMIALLAAICPLAYWRTVNFGGSDFHRFHAAGRYVLDHGQRQEKTILAYYLPSLDVAWAALGCMPLGVAAVVWYAFMSLCWLALLRATARYLIPDADAKTSRQAALAAGLLVLPLALGHLCLGAFHILMLLLVVSGLGRVAAGRWPTGGMLLGLAVWLKLLPGMAVGYLLWKGKWKPALVALLTAAAVDVGLSLAVFGPGVAYDEHVAWWRDEGQGATTRILVGNEQSPEHRSRNQSLSVVLRRTLAMTTVFEANGSVSYFSLANFSLATVRRVYLAAVAAMGLWLLYFWRRRPSRMTSGDWGVEIALVCLATIWFSPIVWSYHATAVLPALAIIIARHDRRPLEVNTVLGVWALSLTLLGVDLARGYGELLWCSWFLAGAMLWARRMPPVTALPAAQSGGDRPASGGLAAAA